MYNLSNLEPKFKNYLIAEKISAVTLRNYLSDVRHFSGWLITGKLIESENINSLNDYVNRINERIIDSYKQHHVKFGLPVKTANRRLSTLRKFFAFCLKEGFCGQNPILNITNLGQKNTENKILPPKIVGNIEIEEAKSTVHHTVFKFDQSLSQINLNKYFLASALVVTLTLTALYGKYILSQKVVSTTLPSKSSPTRYLAFSGKLLDELGNPITTKTDVIFNLYNQETGGRSIYTSACIGEKSAIIPDINGNTQVLLGSDCDSKTLPTEIFTNNQNLYLGITVGTDTEMSPRQNIPNVGLSNDANSIQGLNIGNNSLSVPYINEDGDLLIGTNNSAIRSTHESANFAISSAETVTIESAQAGDVILQATESGTLKLRTGGFTDSYTRLVINNEGNIGIGTLFPTYGFEVNDDVKITNGNRLILASASTDPSGENGAMYYNIQSHKFRCFQSGIWIDCFNGADNNPVGGIYDGNLPDQTDSINLTSQISDLKKELDSLKDQLTNVNKLAVNTVSSFLATNLNVSEKIASPIVETNTIQTEVIEPQAKNLTVDLSQSSDSSISDVKSGTPGPLASLIIKGLEGKTVTTLDSAGNASFSGQLAAENLEVRNNATISGSLYANNIESENLNRLTQDLDAARSDLEKIKLENLTQLENKINSLEESATASTSEVNRESSITTSEVEARWNNELNEIQKLLAEIKNQPLPDPQYYQNLNGLDSADRKLINDLTVSGKSNFYDAAVSNSLNVGNLLFQNNSILSLAWDLKLSALGDIKLFDDGVVIGKDGTIRAKGQLIAGAGVITHKIEAPNASQPVEIDNLALQDLLITNKYLDSTDSASIIASGENFAQNGLSTPSIETQTAIAGTGIIPANSQEVIIYNSKVKDTSLIYLTPTSSIGTILSLSTKESCNNLNNEAMKQFNNTNTCKPYFKVSTAIPSQTTLSFNWLIIN